MSVFVSVRCFKNSLAAVVLLGMLPVSQGVAAEGGSLLGGDLEALISKSGGSYNAAIKTAFLKNSEKMVLRELAGVGVRLSSDQLGFLRNDPVIYEACFGAVFPPDPRIALNLLELRKQLGPEFFDKYKNLLIACAVARRYVGLGRDAFGEKEEWPLRTAQTRERQAGKRIWPEYTVVRINRTQAKSATVLPDSHKKKKGPSNRVKKKRSEKFKKSKSKLADEKGKEIIYDFLVEKKVTPRQLYESPQLQQELMKRMGDHAPKWGKIDYHLLMEVMTDKGLRPAERDPFPSVVEYVRYLDEIKPNFPIKKAPWPIMMPLAKGWPLREARQIWNNYEKSGKLPTYGKYRKKNLVIKSRLEPMPWAWKSWQGIYQAGGVCHEMSSIGLGAYMSVGVPTCKAGQPHHSCILVFNYKNKSFSARTRQGTKGPIATRSQWLFADPDVEVNELYHMGLALSMNRGVSAYMDSRIALHIARVIIKENKKDLAYRMLVSVLPVNPYNTEVWAVLNSLRLPGEDPVLHKAKMIQMLAYYIPTNGSSVKEFKEKPVNVSLAKYDDDDDLDTNPNAGAANYVRIMSKMWFSSGLEPVADKETNREILKLLQGARGSAIPVEQYIPDFMAAVNGWRSLRQPTLDAARKYVALGKKASGSQLANRASLYVKSAVKFSDNDAELLDWLTELEKISSKKMIYKSRRKSKKVYGDPLYRTINAELVNLLTKMNRGDEAAKYRAKLRSVLEKSKGKRS